MSARLVAQSAKPFYDLLWGGAESPLAREQRRLAAILAVALAVDALFILIGLILAGAIVANLATRDASVILVFLVLAVMAARARPMIAIVRTAYANRGWSVTPI